MKKTGAIVIPMIITLAILAGLETGLRLTGFQPAGAAHFSMKFFAPDPNLGFRAYKNARWYFDTTPHGAMVQRIFGTTDSHGYRPTLQNAACHDCPYIVTIGDSVTFGAESPDDSTFPEYIARVLHTHNKDYKILNVSFRGWSTIQGALALKEIDFHGKKVDYVVYTVLPNDFIENIKPMYNLPAPIAKYENNHITIKPPIFDEKFKQMNLKWRIENSMRRFSSTTFIWKWSGKQLIGEYDLLPKIPTDDSAYRGISSKDLEKFQDILKLAFADTPEAHVAQQVFGHEIRDIAETSKNIGAKLLVLPCVLGPFSTAKHGEEFRELLQLNFAEYAALMEDWQRYNAAVKNIALDNGAAYLDVGSNVFAGMSYRDYVAVPNDWHFSVAANEKFGTRVAEKVLTLSK